MKRIAILFACLAILCLSTCENEQLITLLKAPSELVSLEIVAYAGDTQLEGGAAMEPGFTTSVFNYTVYVSKDTDRFTVNAAINGNGTIEIMCEEDQETGTEFDYRDDEPKVMILTVEREYMEEAEYRVTVVREGTVPTATGVEISVTPGIGAFFLGRGVLPEFEVKAHLPAAGGELSYQWFVNTENSSRGGSRINGATGTTYKMRRGETLIARTMYYYAEITNTIDGKTGTTESLPCRVTFLDKKLHEKSWSENYMVNIPAGDVNVGNTYNNYLWSTYLLDDLPLPWSTPGFSMGKYLVTWELWKIVFENAEAGNYRFARIGTQGGKVGGENVIGVGNELNPVTTIGWWDAMVWCNAYSEMDGKEPVYRDSGGNVLRDSRPVLALSFDVDEIVNSETNKIWNGYRLPTKEEWLYAARGANPSTSSSSPWVAYEPGTATDDGSYGEYYWCYSSGRTGRNETGEVGSLKPNTIGLYDMLGMLNQWTTTPGTGIGGEFFVGTVVITFLTWSPDYNTNLGGNYFGLRLVLNKE